MILSINKILRSYLLIACLLIGKAFAQQYKLYEDPAKRFKVSIPPTWTFIPDYNETYFLAHRPVAYKGEAKIENAALSLIKDTIANSLDQVYSSSLLSAKLRDSTMLILEEEKSGKHKYYWYINTHIHGKTNEKVKCMTILFYVKKRPYVLQCTASISSFDTYKPVFLKIADSLQFE